MVKDNSDCAKYMNNSLNIKKKAILCHSLKVKVFMFSQGYLRLLKCLVFYNNYSLLNIYISKFRSSFETILTVCGLTLTHCYYYFLPLFF